MARNASDPSDMQIGQDTAVDLPTTSGRVKRTDKEIEPVEGPMGKDFYEELRFMEEPIDVMIHESTDPAAEMVPEVFHNGVPQRFIRGKVQTVKRKFIEVLARAKKTTFKQEIYADRLTGDAVQRMIPQSALQYPFQIVSDPNPRGPAWLRKVLAEAA